MKIRKIGMIGALTVLLTVPVAGVPALAGNVSAQGPVMKSGSWPVPFSQGNLTNADMVVLFKSWFGFQVNFTVPPKVNDYFERVQD
ncbi:MAG: hypothetical protein IRY98_12070, partial [Alicyclobacillaceae bacterium]|nr:hypothetical protein [Alicyclobacillaceae bacterium]